MNFFKYIILCFLFVSSSLFAQEEQLQAPQKEEKPKLYSYINIDSNIQGTPILIDGEEIGNTPIKSYQVEVGKIIQLKATANKDYFEKDLNKTIKVEKFTQKDIFFKFEKAKAKLFLIGDKAQLFINNKFIKELNENNRIVKVDAGKNTEIYLEDGYKSRMIFKDIKANQFYEVPYTLLFIPEDIRLYTTVVENLMWEDTDHAANAKIDWENANEYCEDSKLAGFTDWRLPTIEELTRLEQRYKDKIYRGYGNTVYWSSDSSVSENQIWSYSDSRNFEKSKTKKPIKELPIGYVRCVRKLDDMNYSEPTEIKKEANDVQMIDEEILRQRRIEQFGYDPEITKDLKKFMLK